MNKCCTCCIDNESKDKGHVFDCNHFLCKDCLESFRGEPLRSVCFTCGSPPVDPTLSPFDNTTNESGKVKTINTGSIVDDFPTKRAVPAELIYNRVQLVLTDVSLSGNRSGGRTESTRPSTRMEGKAQGPRKTSSGRMNTPLADFALTLREKKRELEAAEKAFQEQVVLKRMEIERHAQVCRTLIDRDEKRLLQQLDDMMSAILSENSAAISNIWTLIQRLEKADELDVEETGEVEQLMTTRISTTQFKDVSVHLSDGWTPEERNIVGELKIETIPDHSSFLPTPVLVGSIPAVQHQAVTGITALDREIFVTRDGSQDISVYAVMTNDYLRSLSLLHLLEPIVIPSPIDLAACRTTRSLYVADGSTNNYIYRLRPDGKLIHWWWVDNLRGLSVTTTGTVLVGSGRAIREYDPMGKLVRTISTSPLGSLFRRDRPSMKHPTHFLETDNGRIVVCDFQKDARSPHVVYDVDRKGSDVACCHGNRADAGDEFLNEPRHLAIDVTGHVMVIDRRNDRVKLLDAHLKFVRDLIGAGPSFKRPQRLHYDPARGLLYVGLVAGDTLVFRVTL